MPMTPLKTELEAIRQELAACNVLLLGLSRELSASRVETAVRVEGLRAEQNRDRRLRLMAVAAGGVGVISIDGQYAAHCSPGARLEGAITASEHGVRDQARLQHLYDHPSSALGCDVVMPFNTHSTADWPTAANGLGFAAIAAVVLAVTAVHRWRTRVDFARVEKAARMEERHAPDRD